MPMQQDKPLVSVIMGVLCRDGDPAGLRRSVGSVLEQTLDDLEFLICDDGSSDPVRDYLEHLADKRVRLIRPGGCLSLPDKLNACLREARGRFIARMDDDDRCAPERLERQVAELEKLPPEYGFVGCNVNLARAGGTVGRNILPEEPEVKDFYLVQPFIHPALVFRREVLEAAGGYSAEKRCELCEDYDLLLRLYAKGYRGKNLQDALLDYTIPLTARGKRRMRHRWNETRTRFVRFRELGLLPRALPYVVKPVLTGLLPEPVLKRIKEKRWRNTHA